MISNEQRAHDIAVALVAKKGNVNQPVEAYREYINILLPILKEIDKDFPNGIAEHPGSNQHKKKELQKTCNYFFLLFGITQFQYGYHFDFQR